MSHAPPAVATHIYQACLLLYPAAFRLEFGDEMISDFDEATADAWQHHRWAGLLALWTLVGVDFARTVAIQWLRTGLPLLIALSATDRAKARPSTWSSVCSSHRKAPSRSSAKA